MIYRSQCDCPCHDPGSTVMHFRACCEPDPIRIIPRSPEGIPDTGSFEVWFADGRESRFFHWDDNAGRRAISMSTTMTQDQAKVAAQEFARKASQS